MQVMECCHVITWQHFLPACYGGGIVNCYIDIIGKNLEIIHYFKKYLEKLFNKYTSPVFIRTWGISLFCYSPV